MISYIPGTTNLTGYSQMTNNDYKFICTSPATSASSVSRIMP